jgi:hypothetical protein
MFLKLFVLQALRQLMAEDVAHDKLRLLWMVLLPVLTSPSMIEPLIAVHYFCHSVTWALRAFQLIPVLCSWTFPPANLVHS